MFHWTNYVKTDQFWNIYFTFSLMEPNKFSKPCRWQVILVFYVVFTYLEQILFSSSSRFTFGIVSLFSTHPISHSTPDKVGVSEKDDAILNGELLLNVLIWWEPGIWKCQTWYKHICLKTRSLAEKRRLLLFNRMWPSRQKSTFWQIRRGARYIIWD